jgi:HEAT repeat protein
MRSDGRWSFLLLLLTGCADPGPQSPSAGQLVSMLEEADPKVQLEATAWVSQFGPKAVETVPALIAALKSPHVAVRQSAALALEKIGPASAEAIPALTGALQDPQYIVRKAAADTLGSLGPAAKSAIPALDKMSQLPDRCNSAQSAIKKIQPK